MSSQVALPAFGPGQIIDHSCTSVVSTDCFFILTRRRSNYMRTASIFEGVSCMGISHLPTILNSTSDIGGLNPGSSNKEGSNCSLLWRSFLSHHASLRRIYLFGCLTKFSLFARFVKANLTADKSGLSSVYWRWIGTHEWPLRTRCRSNGHLAHAGPTTRC